MVKIGMMVCIAFQMCVSICAQPLPSHFRGRGREVGYKTIERKVYAHPTPYPSPEMGGEWLRQKTGRRITGINVVPI